MRDLRPREILQQNRLGQKKDATKEKTSGLTGVQARKKIGERPDLNAVRSLKLFSASKMKLSGGLK